MRFLKKMHDGGSSSLFLHSSSSQTSLWMFISTPSHILTQIILSAIMRHTQDNQVIRPSQHGFMKDRSYLTKLISFYDKVTT